MVIDNPPFSIISKIVRFYHKNEIPFFLFAPALTLFGAAAEKAKTFWPLSEAEREAIQRLGTQ